MIVICFAVFIYTRRSKNINVQLNVFRLIFLKFFQTWCSINLNYCVIYYVSIRWVEIMFKTVPFTSLFNIEYLSYNNRTGLSCLRTQVGENSTQSFLNRHFFLNTKPTVLWKIVSVSEVWVKAPEHRAVCVNLYSLHNTLASRRGFAVFVVSNACSLFV